MRFHGGVVNAQEFICGSHHVDTIRFAFRALLVHNTWKIIYLDEPLDDSGEDAIESLIGSPYTKLPEQICIEKETAVELREAIDALPDRENVYVQYRFGFTDGEVHPLTETAQYFRLSESRTKGHRAFRTETAST